MSIEGQSTDLPFAPADDASTAYGDTTDLLNEHQAPSADAPAESAAPAATDTAAASTPAQGQAAAAAAAVAGPEFTITRNGEVIRVPVTDPRIQQWLNQGYDYGQRMGEFNRQRAEYEAQQKALTERYGAVDEFVRTPQGQAWWNTVQAQFQAQQAADPTHPIAQKLSQVEQTLNSVVAAEQARQIEIEDRKLHDEIESLRKEYADIDLNAVDPASGQTLMQRVGRFALDNKIPSYTHAFKLFNHDALVKRSADKAREEAAKALQANKKAGLLGTTPTPTKGLKGPSGNKNQSYLDAALEGLAELTGEAS